MQETVLTLIEIEPDLTALLFDFAAPAKSDLRQFMEQYYMQELDLAGLAHYSGRSLAAFKQEFSATFGMPPAPMDHTPPPGGGAPPHHAGRAAAAVCAEVGFKSLSHFSRAFKQQFGLPPS